MVLSRLCLLFLLAPAACVQGGGSDFETYERTRPNLFISPHGEPFRAERGAPRPIGAWFAKADRNHDGAIDPAEFRADAADFFARLDADANGTLDGFEIVAYETRIAPEILPDHGATRPSSEAERDDGPILLEGRRRGFDPRLLGGGGVNPWGASAFGLLADAQPISSADFDQSRSVSRAEFQRAADERFAALDRPREGPAAGRLTLQALQQLPAPRLEARSRRSRR